MKKTEIICIIDDDPIYVYAIKWLLEDNELCKDIIEFNNGKKAIEYFQNTNAPDCIIPDIIILDINMPVMDGWQFLDEFIPIKAQIEKEIKIFMISSSIDSTDIDKAKEYKDLTDYILKPIEILDLKRIISS